MKSNIALVCLVLVILLLPATSHAISIDELRELIPRGDDFSETTGFCVTRSLRENVALSRGYIEIWCLPDGSIAIVSGWDSVPLQQRLFTDVSLRDDCDGIIPKNDLYVLGDRFFGLVNTEMWSDETVSISEKTMPSGRVVYEVIYTRPPMGHREYIIDKDSGELLRLSYVQDGIEYYTMMTSKISGNVILPPHHWRVLREFK